MPQMPQDMKNETGPVPPPMAEPMPEGGAPQGDPMAEMEAMAPMPETAYSVQAIKTLVSQFNDTLEALAGGELPDVEWDPGDAGPKWQEALPLEIFLPLMALDEALTVIAGSEMAKKYELAPTTIKSDGDLRKVSATLRSMEKDKKLAKIMQSQQPATEPGAGGPPPAPQGEMSEDEEAVLQQNLA